MTAALTQPRSDLKRGDGLRPTNLVRDLYQIAELIELCFGPRLDSDGRAAVREMKAVARMGPLLWLLALLDWAGAGLGLGFVWRVNKRVVGNASLYHGGMHPYLGRGWLLANVAVHPDFRRQHIAHDLVHACLSLARHRGGAWTALQVEADNQAALDLYRNLGFEQFEALSHWKVHYDDLTLPEVDTGGWPIRRRFVTEAAPEADLIYTRARLGAIAWAQPIEQYDLRGYLDLLGSQFKERWVLPDPNRPGYLLGSLWVEVSSRRRARLTLFLDPALRDPRGRQALLLYALRRPTLQRRVVRLETVAGDAPIEEALRTAGFREARTLMQMRRSLSSVR